MLILNKKFPMKVLLNGATAGTNFGDFLFAKMFQDRLAKLVGLLNVRWYKSRYALSDFYSRHLNYHNNYKLNEIDLLIFISGGYFHGDDRCTKDYILRYLRYFHIGLKCILRRIPYAIFGVEVGISPCRWLRLIEKIILSKAHVVIVRNKESEISFKIMMGENATVITTSDSVFAMEPSFFEDAPLDVEFNSNYKHLFLHINPTIEANKTIKEKIIPIVNDFCKTHPEFIVVVGADQYNESQEIVYNDIKDNLLADNVIFSKYDNPLSLCRVLDNCDLVITHKLHVGIVSAHLGKSVISFSGHSSKIERLYNQLNESRRSIPLNTLTRAEGLKILEEFYNIPINVPADITDKAKLNFKYLDDFVLKFSK